MKKLLMIPVLLLLLACEEKGELTKDGFNVATINQDAVLKYHGTFVPTSGISATGDVEIYLENNQYKVKLNNFVVTDGPDLKIYLSKAATPNDFVSLGNLTSATVYNVPQGVDVTGYSHILIHCQQYNHLFAIAQLIQN